MIPTSSLRITEEGLESILFLTSWILDWSCFQCAWKKVSLRKKLTGC